MNRTDFRTWDLGATSDVGQQQEVGAHVATGSGLLSPTLCSVLDTVFKDTVSQQQLAASTQISEKVLLDIKRPPHPEPTLDKDCSPNGAHFNVLERSCHCVINKASARQAADAETVEPQPT
ncbi:hypothetical protein Q8A73_023310 [Channa argus]|nr:hypothetical protein Q8A73_023310 [Channa argus]